MDIMELLSVMIVDVSCKVISTNIFIHCTPFEYQGGFPVTFTMKLYFLIGNLYSFLLCEYW